MLNEQSILGSMLEWSEKTSGRETRRDPLITSHQKEVSCDLNPGFVALAWEAWQRLLLHVEAREQIHQASGGWPVTPQKEGSYPSSVFALLLWCYLKWQNCYSENLLIQCCQNGTSWIFLALKLPFSTAGSFFVGFRSSNFYSKSTLFWFIILLRHHVMSFIPFFEQNSKNLIRVT